MYKTIELILLIGFAGSIITLTFLPFFLPLIDTSRREEFCMSTNFKSIALKEVSWPFLAFGILRVSADCIKEGEN